jgi:DNA-binding transcriptional ArsR family regulator
LPGQFSAKRIQIRTVLQIFNSHVNYPLDIKTLCTIFNAVVNNQKKVSNVFAALADPTRRRIMERLSGHGERRVTALAKPFRISLPAVSRHLHVLERARLIQRRRQGRTHLIRTRIAGLKEAQRWLMRCALQWDSRFDAIDALLAEDERKGKER